MDLRSPLPPHGTGSKPTRVLVVDADLDLSAIVQDSLPDGGTYRVERATSADQAQELIACAPGHYTVALISETLPRCPGSKPEAIGLDLLRRLKARSPNTEIIFLAANGHSSAVAALQAGAFNYLEKPLRDPAEVGIFVGRAAQLRDLREVAEVREEKLTRLRKLSNASREIMADLINTPLEKRLTAIAKHATKILNAEACGVSMVRKPGMLTLEASHGHKSGEFPRGLELPIRAGRKTGLSGFIAAKGELFNVHGRDLNDHPAVRTKSDKCYSLLAIPLFRRQRDPDTDPKEEIVGLLRAENKLANDGRPHPELRFTKEDEWILKIFAEKVVVANDFADLVDQLKEEKDYKDGLINSSPNGLITIDTHGTVIEFNAQAEDMLGYGTEEARGMSVRNFYLDPETPQTIGAELDERGGSLTAYSTFLRCHDGKSIPVRLSAIWLYDASGKRKIGSAGFFEDLRGIQRLKTRQALLIQASKVVAESQDLGQGLQKLAEMMLGLLPHTFCRILLRRGDRASMVVEAALHVTENEESDSWRPGIDTELKLEEWPGLADILKRKNPTVLSLSSRRRPLERLSQLLSLTSPIQTLLLVPWQLDDHVFSGLLEVGEVRSSGEHPIPKAEQDLALAIAAHTATLIGRIRLHRKAERRYRLAAALADVMVLGETQKTLESIARSTRDGVRCDVVTLYPYDAAIGAFTQEPEACGLRHEEHIFAEYDAATSPIVQEVLSGGLRIFVEDTHQDPRTKDAPFTRIEDIRTFIAIPLLAGGEPVGVMFVSYRSLHHFTDAERTSIKLFANQAAIAIQNAQRHEKTKRHNEELEALHEAARAMASAIKADDVSQAIVENAQKMFGAATAVLWPYDSSREEFLLESPAAVGLSSEDLARAKELRPEPGHSRYKALEEGWISEEDVAGAKREHLTEAGRRIAQRSGVRSYQGIALRVAEEPVGVLFVGYSQPRKYSSSGWKNLANFANYAALSLKKSRLLDQVQRANLSAEILAQISTLTESKNATLLAVATMTPPVVGCDAMRLYLRDFPSSDFTCHYLKQGKEAQQARLVSEPIMESGPLHCILDRKELIIICDRSSDVPAGCGWLAEEAAEFASWVAISMKVAERGIGIFFVGFERPQHFLDDEINSIGLLAHQTAIALANDQLYEERRSP